MKSFLKRTVAILMILLAIGCVAPFANIVTAANSGPSTKGLITNTGDKITRAEWLHNLAVVFEMTVEDEIYPDNYFSDLEDTHEYYYDLLLNVNFGVIDVEAGGEVNPDGAVTRSFAAQTLNYCLGYQLENETYTFSDSALCEYPADAQVAINRGWFVLVEGKFCPEMAVTDKEVKAMIDDTEDIIDDSEIDVDYDSKFTFSSEVVEVKDGTELEFNGDVITIKNSSVKIANGDIFAVYQSGIPLVYKAESVSKNGNNIMVTASYIEENVDKYILEADAQGEADFEDVMITPAEGVEVDLNYEEPPVSLFAFGRGDGKKKIANISAKGTINLSDFGYSVSYSVEMKNPTILYAYNLSKRTAQVSFECEIEDKATFKADLLKAGFIDKEVMIYTLSVPGVGGLDVCLKFDLSGSVSVVSKNNFKVGASYSPKDNFRTIKNFSGGSFSLEAKISGSAGVIVKLGVTQFELVNAYLYAEAGGKASVDLKMYSSGTPKNCVEFAAYVYANYGATFEIDAGIWKYEAKAEEKIWDSKTSPARIVKHYEEEKPVPKCTRGGTGSSGPSGSGGGGSRGNYYTKYDSAYSGGWSDGDNSYGFDKTGKPVQLFEYKLDKEGNATITAYKGNATVVNIPETIDGHKVIAVGKSAFAGNSLVRTVYLADTINNLENGAFKNCVNLSDVRLSKNVSTNGMAGTNSSFPGPFFGCVNLKTIEFADGTTSISNGIFHNTGIESILIPNTVTTIEEKAFSDCTLLEEIILPDSVSYLGEGAFNNCTGVFKLRLSRNVTTSGMAGTNGSFPGPFFGCVNLKTVEFADGTTIINNGIFHNTGIESILIPNTVTTIEEKAFSDCILLEEIILPDSVSYLGEGAFNNCTGVVKLRLSRNVTTSGMAGTNNSFPGPFFGCENLKTIEFADETTIINNGIFHNTGIESILIPTTVTHIDDSVFKNCSLLKNIVLPNSVKTIGENVFESCTNLKKATISKGLTTLSESMFLNSGLESIEITENITIIKNNVFKGNKYLKKVIFSDTIETIPASAFEGCTSLKTITLPESITSIGTSSFYNSGLETIKLPSMVQTVGKTAFKNCTSLKEITFNEGLTSVGESIFENCDALTSIIFPNSVKTIGNSAFYDCDTLKTVTLGNGLEAIPNNAFEHCDVLSEIVLPYRVASIGSNVFKDCVKFTSITIPRATTKIADNAFSYLDRLTIYGVSGTYAETYAKDKGIKFVNKSVPATKVELSETELSLAKGATATLVLNITPVNFTDAVAWKSSDESIVTIDDTGKVTAKGLGTATIKVDVGSVSTTCKVTVVQPVTKVNIDKSSVDLQAHETIQLKVTVGPDKAANKAVKWSTSDETIATVDQNGLVKAIKKGSVTIRCEALDGSGKYDTCAINVKNNGVIAVTVSELESTHDYPVDCTDFWQYTINGASKIDVTFDSKTNIEDGFDYLYIYDSTGKEVGKYTGTTLAGKTITIDGNTVRLQLASDKSGTAWGFKVTDVKPASSSGGHTHSYTATVTQEATCWREGTKTFSCSCGDTYVEKIDKLDHEVYRWEVKKKPTCTEAGLEWSYCLNCDMDLERDIPATGHTVINYTRRATPDEDGAYVTACDVCNEVFEEIPFSRPTVFKLSTSSCTYNGKTRKPSVTVKDADGKTLVEGKDYTIIYPSGMKLPGKYSVKVLFDGEYLGERNLTFTIKPKAPTNLSATQDTKSIKLSWSKSTGVTGYQVYKYDSKTKKYVKVTSTSKTSASINKLSSGTSYKFRVRAYKKVDGGYIYSSYVYITTATKPAVPTLKVSSTAKTKATLSWTNVSGESGYQIYYSTDKSGNYKKLTNVGADKTKNTATKLKSSKTYYFKVRAYKKVDGKTVYGNFSSVKSVKIK